ncbi:putative cytochrome b5 [Dipodascopsis tothii]|uniref:putative cytochrome b5 n=1 Tax=Dipodascopsis tothii TaxID=44089 RepID=UPI0034CDC735
MSEKTFTYADIESHKTRDDLWMVVHGKVYDVTKFVDEHPGGEEVLVDCGGEDATDAFEDIGHSDEARKVLDDLLVGDLDASEKRKSTKAAPTAGSEISSEPASAPSFVTILSIVLALVAAYIAYTKYM